jgi:S-adenosylmethionine hydrolase
VDQLTRPILLLTDFGLRDHYAGQVKAVLADLAPASAVIDISHGVAKYAIDEGAWMLETALAAAPADAVVMAVVDPGVGSMRKAICVEAGDRSFIGPDNGLLSCAFSEAERTAGARIDTTVYELSNPEFQRGHVSYTFHGRDIFAPAAAARARGVEAEKLGPKLDAAVLLSPFAGVVRDDGTIAGEVVHVDSYGNLVTTIREVQLPAEYVVQVAGTAVKGGNKTFSDVGPGELLTHIDSSGFLAIAANLGSAVSKLRAKRGTAVEVRPA